MVRGDGLSQHGREKQDGEVQRLVYMSWKIKWNKDSYSMREIWEKEIHVQSANGGVKVGATSMGTHKNFRKGGMPKNAPHMEKKVTKRPPHGEKRS